MNLLSITEIWTYCTERNVVWEHYRNLNLLHSTRCRLRALQKSELIALSEMSFESIREIWNYCTQRYIVWNLNLLHLLHSTICRLGDVLRLRALQKSVRALQKCTQRDVVWEHYRNLNLLHSTGCSLRALQKSEPIALNEMSLESITGRWTYCTQRYVVWEHYRNLNLLH